MMKIGIFISRFIYYEYTLLLLRHTSRYGYLYIRINLILFDNYGFYVTPAIYMNDRRPHILVMILLLSDNTRYVYVVDWIFILYVTINIPMKILYIILALVSSL